MQIKQFRITNFRSIVDSGWIRLSQDGVTVLIGQNESGKTATLEALSLTLNNDRLPDEVTRFDTELPKTYLRVQLSQQDTETLLADLAKPASIAFQTYIANKSGLLELAFGWEQSPQGAAERFRRITDIEDPALGEILNTAATAIDADKEEPGNKSINTTEEFGKKIWQEAPATELFRQDIGSLPNMIQITADNKLSGKGAEAAQNYLDVAGIDLAKLLTFDLRAQENYLKRANKHITQEFGRFWTQLIGARRPLDLDCELKFNDATPAIKGATAGSPYLVFWISDQLTRLYPRQRSAGVRWFVSFFLQLKATERLKDSRIFLLDEPGANLHARAQQDVLRLMESLSKTIPIVYSTHSQDMIDFDKLYRIRAIQRDSEADDDSPTRILEAEHLAAASSDTLSPLLAAMGIDFSRQQLIPQRGNILLEEVSALYYLRAFWKLTACPAAVSFLPMTGASKIPQVAFLFLGWRLEFGVVIDDDPHGRAVYNELRDELFEGDDSIAKRHMLKIKGCHGIEDLFTANDFKNYVCTEFDGNHPSQWLKSTRKSKPLLASTFLNRVLSEAISLDALEPATRSAIANLVDEIAALDAVAKAAAI